MKLNSSLILSHVSVIPSFSGPPPPPWRRNKHSFQCMFLADWWSSKIMITCTFWKLNCSTSWPYRTFEGLVINVLILDDGWITGWAKYHVRKISLPSSPPLYLLSKASALLRFKLGKIQLPESWSKYISTQMKFSILFLIKAKKKQLLKSMYQPRFNIT